MRLLGLLRFEALLALVLAAVPIVLRVADDRGSISAYHDMDDPRWFFVPLTAAAVMLVTNGFVYAERHIHYAVLGVLLIGVVLFDHDGASATVHFIAAVAFYVVGLAAAALMAAHYLGVASFRSVLTIAVSIGLALLVVAFVTEPPVFWVEAVGLWMIAAYYLWHGWAEAKTPADHSEPLVVLRAVLPPPLLKVVEVFIRPFEWLWNRFNSVRSSAGSAAP